MFSLQKYFSKDDQFFNLLEASATEARASALALKKVLVAPSGPSLEELISRRRKDKEITNEIKSLLCHSFVTRLEREDIIALASALYKIPKTVEKFAERYVKVAEFIKDADFHRQADLLEQATDNVVVMITGLRKTTDLIKLNDHTANMQRIEGEADRLIVDLLREVYSGKHAPLKAVCLKEMYELLEKVIDRCRDAGNVVAQIILKYS